MRAALISPVTATLSGRMFSRGAGSFPLGLGYIAAYLRRAGHEARIFAPDITGATMEETWAAVGGFRPDLVGVTAVTGTFMEARRVAAEAKRRFGRPVVMGGVHANALPRSTLLGLPELDAVICGEGEAPMLALAESFDRTGKIDFTAVAGAAFLKNGEFVQNPPGAPIADLDSLPRPALDLLHKGDWSRGAPGAVRVPHALVISSRGCPSLCTFCVNHRLGRRFRARSPENFVDELEELRRKYGTTSFSIADDCFTADPRRAWEICDLIIKRKLDIRWKAAGRVNTLTHEGLVAHMRRAGCTAVGIGVETASRRIGELIKKGTTPEQAEQCCAVLRKFGLPYFASFMYGNEGETTATALETLAFAIRLKPSYAIFNVTIPSPGSELFDKFYSDFDRPDTDWTNWTAAPGARPYEPRQTVLTNRQLRRLCLWSNLRFFGHPLRLLRLVSEMGFSG